MSNKVIHAENVEWDFSADHPNIRCAGRADEKWTSAEIVIPNLLALGAQLGS
jgi:hypothetical protein